MSFFARPNLDDIQFKQTKDSKLTLSGETIIDSVSGLTLSDETGRHIPISLEGASNAGATGKVMTFDGSKVVLEAPSTGDTFYEGSSPSTIGVGGMGVGATLTGRTWSSILEEILVPSIGPLSSINFSSVNINRQFGDGNTTGGLLWTVTKKSEFISDIQLCTDGTGNINKTLLVGGVSNSTGGTETYQVQTTHVTPSTGTTNTTATYKVFVKDTSNKSNLTTTNITWRNKRFYFGDTILYTDNTINGKLFGLAGELSSSKNLTTSLTLTNQYFYYAYPKSFGLPTFNVGGLTNNAWGNPLNNTLYEVEFTNTNNYVNRYYIARSDNKLNGTFTIIIT